ncbi:MAG TPA: LLM class flavin-dependent oxidoreductase [Actinophytocola sp.]|jgi:alkanesulfonate monooxygenase SsuD/methylene tetrahydromethanopterin reductase-like flavin-dependent oxidoreductase (luciferase family)|uniref:LLM class flavin-dependent oxidoreductase n=1 Tax=Actinophytocola sp. TaxID=1872138 RepID=UPI002F930239
MDIGIGLPVKVPGVSESDILDWAVQADRLGFSSVAITDRIVYDNLESLTTLAAVAAVTERVKLVTTILVSPLHTNDVLLAKQLATIDRISGGRLVLGLSAGSRPDDYEASGVPMKGRGRRVEDQLARLREIWAGKRMGYAGAVGPAPTDPDGPPVLLGGHTPPAIKRAARLGDGWISGGGGVGMFMGGAKEFRAAWAELGREGEPRTTVLAYYSLGPSARDLAESYLLSYYGFAPPYANVVLNNAAVGADKLRQQVAAYEAGGCDEVYFFPSGYGIDQLTELRELTA